MAESPAQLKIMKDPSPQTRKPSVHVHTVTHGEISQTKSDRTE